METLAVEMRDITKIFGGVKANDRIQFCLRAGSIHGLLGENGAGKTTLMNILYGLYRQEEGEILIRGQKQEISSPIKAISLGIGMVHQHFMLARSLTVVENVMLGRKSRKGILLDTRETAEELVALAERYRMKVDPYAKVWQLSVGEQQRVEILTAIYQGADILILDEPTAVLTPQETQKLFAILRRMKEQGSAIIIITHKLNEVMEISDRVTILRKGKSIDTVNTAETNEKQLTELMVGRPVTLEIDRPKCENVHTRLKVVDLSVKKADGTMALKDLSFEIKAGEILGVAGIAGSGQKELCEAIAGLVPVETGAVLHNKENIIGKTPKQINNLGISLGFVPEDRLGMGLVASMGMVDNMLLKSYDKAKGIFVDRKPAKKLAEELVERLEIMTPNVETPVRLLSGGNVQKVLLGREIESEPSVLITAYPVRGLDINSSYTIYDLLNEQKKKGVAVMFIGEDLDVLLEISDRIMVLCHGEVTGIVDAAVTTKEELGLMMTGSKREGVKADG